MTAAPVMKRVLIYGAILAVAIAVIGSVIGYLVAGELGVVSALMGTAMAVVFLAITAVSILIAGKYNLAAFFGIVMGAWLLKLVLFFILILVLKDQPWIHPQVMFLSIVAGVIGTLVVDVVVVAKSRLSYVSDVKLPGDADGDGQRR